MLELLQRIFRRDSYKTSKDVAHERLRLVLMHDRYGSFTKGDGGTTY